MNWEENVKQQFELAKQIQLLENGLRNHLTKEALTRYYNIKTVNKEKAIQILALMMQLIQSGQIKEPLTDARFKEILLLLEQRKSPTIHLKKLA